MPKASRITFIKASDRLSTISVPFNHGVLLVDDGTTDGHIQLKSDRLHDIIDRHMRSVKNSTEYNKLMRISKLLTAELDGDSITIIAEDVPLVEILQYVYDRGRLRMAEEILEIIKDDT